MKDCFEVSIKKGLTWWRSIWDRSFINVHDIAKALFFDIHFHCLKRQGGSGGFSVRCCPGRKTASEKYRVGIFSNVISRLFSHCYTTSQTPRRSCFQHRNQSGIFQRTRSAMINEATTITELISLICNHKHFKTKTITGLYVINKLRQYPSTSISSWFYFAF